MKQVTKLAFQFSNFKPIRGRQMEGKWQILKAYVQRHNFSPQKMGKHQNQAIVQQKVKAVQDFRVFLKENIFARMYLQNGLDQIPSTVNFHYEDQFGIVEAKPRQGVSHGYTWEKLLNCFASVAVTPPRFQDAVMTGVPFSSFVFDLLNTVQGRFFFSIPQVNYHLKRIFNTYAEMLDSPSSLVFMNEEQGGWFSSKALSRINYNEYICDQTAPHLGFKSWHEWFTRQIKEDARPFNKNQDQIINNSQSFPYYFTPYKNVQWNDKFWLKDYRYSLQEMFELSNESEDQQNFYKDAFVGGTIYQGFLTPWCYHRWRSPVSGKIVKCFNAGQTYFAVNPSLDLNLNNSYVYSQPMLSMTSARQIYVIKADNPKIGHIAIIEIGMGQVSGIKNLVKEGQRINKGDLMGYFRFGGSSHLILFDRKASNLRFNDTIYERKINPETRTNESILQKVRSPLAWVN